MVYGWAHVYQDEFAYESKHAANKSAVSVHFKVSEFKTFGCMVRKPNFGDVCPATAMISLCICIFVWI